MSLTSGTRLGVYEISAPIGEGGMGAVYRATDTTLSRQVATKIFGGGEDVQQGRQYETSPATGAF